MIAGYLETRLKAAGIPIVSVSLGRLEDRKTWTVQYAANATSQQRTTGDALIASEDISAAVLAAAESQQRMDGDKVLRALVIWLAGKLSMTPAQARQELLTIYRNL